MAKEDNFLALNTGIQTNQILTKDDEVCIPRLSSILLAVAKEWCQPIWDLLLKDNIGQFFIHWFADSI